MLEIGQRFKFTDGQGKVSEYVIPESVTLAGRPQPGLESPGDPAPHTAVFLENVETGKCAAIMCGTLTGVSPWPGSGEWGPA